jgi:hypothetical protein
LAVEPFGSTTPDEPGIALMVSLPTVAIAIAEVEIGIESFDVDGVNTGESDWLLDVAGAGERGVNAGAEVA